jgi:rubrerythrin
MNLETFLAHAVKLEHEAAVTYAKSVEVATAAGNQDAAAFFGEMAGYANLHLNEVMTQAGYKDVSDIPQLSYQWGNRSAPETLDPPPASGEIIDLDGAMARALDAERRAVAFYEGAAQSSAESQVRTLALEFAAEERKHVLALERFMGSKPY